MSKYINCFNTKQDFSSKFVKHKTDIVYIKENKLKVYKNDLYDYLDYNYAPLSFEILEDGTVGSTFTKIVEYRLNDNDWKVFDSNVSVKEGDIISFRGNNNIYGQGPYTNSLYYFNTTCRFNVFGNIMSLINSTNFYNLNSIPSEYCFQWLFKNCTTLISAKNLILSATILSNYCYSWIFDGCISLTIPPKLPATILSHYCYSNMFSYCTNLITAPELPATTLASYCYHHMFLRCTSLTVAPELPATILEEGCYSSMFSGCISLTNTPELPAITLADSCYSFMFRDTNLLPDCTNIDFTSESVVTSGALKGLFAGTKITDNDLNKILPKNSNNKYYLPVTSLSFGCYTRMFRDCTLLTTAPELPATILTNQCYYEMFCGCSSLINAPKLPATTLGNSCYYMMFHNCISLTIAPELPATTLTSWCYGYMFESCTSLSTAPELPAPNLIYNNCYYGMFWDCTNLNYIKCLAINMSGYNCLNRWVENVSSSGTFIKNPNATWSTGSSGIPSSWTVQDAA